MKIVHILICLMLVLFTAVQYNDPDFYLWMPIYIIPALWNGYAAFKPARIQNISARSALVVCIALALAGTAYYWPTDEGFWRQEVYWQSEQAREGMGMMIAAIALLVALPATARRRTT